MGGDSGRAENVGDTVVAHRPDATASTADGQALLPSHDGSAASQHSSVVAVADDHEQGMLRRRLGFWDGVALVVGLMVRVWWMMLSMHEGAHHGQLAGNLCRWGVEYSHPQATL